MARSCVQDPLEKFRFGVTWSFGDPIEMDVAGEKISVKAPAPKAGFHDVQSPKRATNKINYREGTDPDVSSISAGLSSMEDIVLTRGLFPTASTFQEIAEWTKYVHSSASTDTLGGQNVVRAATGALDYRKEVWIWMYDRSGAIVRVWKLFNAFPVNYVPGSDLNASEDGEKSMESVTLAYEDFIELAPGAEGTFPTSESTPIVG